MSTKAKLLPGAAKMKPIKMRSMNFTLEENPEWKKQYAIVKREFLKLSKMSVATLEVK